MNTEEGDSVKTKVLVDAWMVDEANAAFAEVFELDKEIVLLDSLIKTQESKISSLEESNSDLKKSLHNEEAKTSLLIEKEKIKDSNHKEDIKKRRRRSFMNGLALGLVISSTLILL